MRKTMMAVVVTAIALAAGQASAVIVQYEAVLSGLNEVPANPSPGTGYVAMDFDTVTNSLMITLGTYSGLVAPSTAAHYHQAPAGINGPVIIPLAHSSATAGNLTGGGILSAAQVTALTAGQLYVNVHSTTFPGGEIRGQITLVPGPGALALFGLAGMAGTRRRRRD